jgi:6-phosphogluconolactonase
MNQYFFILLLLIVSNVKVVGNDNQKVVNLENEADETSFISSENQADKQLTPGQDFYFYVGTYTGKGSEGIYKVTFQSGNGEISAPELAATITNPSFQCISKNHQLLWSAGESGSGSVTGFLIDTLTGNLQKTETFSSMGNGTCFVNFNDESLNVIAANYSTGNVTKIPVTASGMENGKSFTHKHTGKGPNASRQEAPHAHCAKVDPIGKYIYSCDLGADKIYVYTVSVDSLAVFKTIITEPGAGPRHIAFHPQLKSMAVINELNNTVSTYLPDESGCFSILLHTITTLPDDFKAFSKCADIHFTPDGKFLYASNRGHNSIVYYKFDRSTLKPKLLGWQTKDCQNTRNFAIDPTGNYLIAANQDANNIVVYKINHKTGELTDTGFRRSISQPVCITFLSTELKN